MQYIQNFLLRKMFKKKLLLYQNVGFTGTFPMRRFDNLSYRDNSIMSIVRQQEKRDALHKSGKKEKFHNTDGEQRCHVGQKQEDLRSLQRGTDSKTP